MGNELILQTCGAVLLVFLVLYISRIVYRILNVRTEKRIAKFEQEAAAKAVAKINESKKKMQYASKNSSNSLNNNNNNTFSQITETKKPEVKAIEATKANLATHDSGIELSKNPSPLLTLASSSVKSRHSSQNDDQTQTDYINQRIELKNEARKNSRKNKLRAQNSLGAMYNYKNPNANSSNRSNQNVRNWLNNSNGQESEDLIGGNEVSSSSRFIRRATETR